MRAAFYTLGCKVNQYDTDAMAELFEAAGYTRVDFSAAADVYVINTCSVTQMSDKKSRQMISRAHALSPKAAIVVTGCYAQRAPEEVLALPGVTVVSGTKDHAKVLQAARTAAQEGAALNLVEDIREQREFEVVRATKENRTRATLKIQDGCDNYCTYCIIPYTRGHIRSRALSSVREELEALAREGYREVVLTGIHLMSYGKDLKGDVTLLDAILQAESVNGIDRIRLSSLEPQAFSDETLRYLAGNVQICRHFHLSLQSGSDAVLSRMNRRYTAEQYALCVERIRGAMPDCAITTDVIVGFPGETQQEFEESLAFVERMSFARIHVFPYSRRQGTKAAAFPAQIPNKEKGERVRAMIECGDRLEQAFLKNMVGTVQEVLAEEQTDEETLEGTSRNYARVSFIAPESLVGVPCSVHIHAISNGKLKGNVI